MPVQREWNEPELSLYGSVENITEQVFGKEAGTGDTITFIINGSPITVDVPGQEGSLISL